MNKLGLGAWVGNTDWDEGYMRSQQVRLGVAVSVGGTESKIESRSQT